MQKLVQLLAFLGFCIVGILSFVAVDGVVSGTARRKIDKINREGPYLGIVVPNVFELNPLLQSPSYVPHNELPYLDFAGKRFLIATVENKSVIVVKTGLSMLNAGITTQLLVSLFNVEGVLHIGIAGNANPNLQIGDVTIPKYWAHTGLWNWQRFGDGPDDELPLESNGDYTRSIGYLNFSDFNTNPSSTQIQNLLNNIWFQPEEVFPVCGNPEIRQHAFWIQTNPHYYSISKKLEGMKLKRCINCSNCLRRTPMVIRIERGISSNIFVDNSAYREFLYSKFNATAIDMESAAVSLICLQQNIPFLAFRALSDLAGGNGSSTAGNEAAVFDSLAAQNAVDVLITFLSHL